MILLIFKILGHKIKHIYIFLIFNEIVNFQCITYNVLEGINEKIIAKTVKRFFFLFFQIAKRYPNHHSLESEKKGRERESI